MRSEVSWTAIRGLGAVIPGLLLGCRTGPPVDTMDTTPTSPDASSYVESIDEFLCDIENRTVRTPSDDLHRWAHTIKSSAASIGAMRLAHLAAQMEKSYRDREQIDLGQQLQSMQQEYQRVNATLEKITGS